MINLKILILEDDLDLLDRLTSILKREVREVYSFNDSTLAYKKIIIIMPDLIKSDIVINNMTGLEMYKKLKLEGIIIPIILASAFNKTKYFIEAVKLRVNHFLVKPIDREELLNKIVNLNQKKEELLIVQSRWLKWEKWCKI